MEDRPEPLARLVEAVSREKAEVDFQALDETVRAYLDWSDEKRREELQGEDYTDRELGEHLFQRSIGEDDYPDYIDHQWFAHLVSLERVLLEPEQIPPGYQETYLRLLRKYGEDFELMYEHYRAIQRGGRSDYRIWSRNTAASRNAYEAAQLAFTGQTIDRPELKEHVLQPSSVIFLRQFMESSIRNALGVERFFDARVEWYFEPSFRELVAFLEDHPEKIYLPVAGSLLRNIYAWTNIYLHDRILPPVWQLEWALSFTRPLYEETGAQEGKPASGDAANPGSIVFRRSFYEDRFHSLLETYLDGRHGSKKVRLVGTADDPEARLVDGDAFPG